MFTGIVEATGRIHAVEDRESTRLVRIATPELGPELAPGASVSVDGACLTVTEADPTGFAVDVIGTTLERTLAGRYRVGGRVNLERALQMGSRLDGHLVQGHIDGIGHMTRCSKDGEFWMMDFDLPPDVVRQTVPRGSITLNGVSLTVAGLLDQGCTIGVIPFTFEHTNLGALQAGDPVNVEGDLIGKYVGRMLAPREPGSA
jgi:riboflavin synthase